MPDLGPDLGPDSRADAGQDKPTLRKEQLQRRNSIPPAVRKVKNTAIQASLEALDEIDTAGAVLLFASFRSEVDMTGMIISTLAASKRVILPKVDAATGTLQLYEISSPADLVPGYMGIPEPRGSTDKLIPDINEIDAVVIPGACFDAKGNRVGYGGGYYDRLLAGLRKTIPIIAPAYEEQIVDKIPVESHDIRVNIIVTDRRVIRCVKETGKDLPPINTY